MTNAAETPSSEQALEAREVLLREEFRLQEGFWDNATPLEDVLSELKAKITHKK